MWSVQYHAYGNIYFQHVNKIPNPLRFQGQYFDDESGLYYNRHRYYHLNSGRFITADPIGLAGGLNSYQYVKNPTGWVDPLGLHSVPMAGGGCGGKSESGKSDESPLSDEVETPKVAQNTDDLVTVRHHASPQDLTSIKADGAINPARRAGMDNNIGVHVEVDPISPIKSAPREVGATYEGAYIDFQVPRSSLIPTYVGP